MRRVVAWVMCIGLAFAAGARGEMVVGGGGDQGAGAAPIWFTGEMVGGTRVNLILPENEAGTFVFGIDVARAPIAMTRDGVRTLLVFEVPASDGGSRPVRQAIAEFGPGDRLIGARLEVLPSLPGDGAFAGVVSTDQGDFALLIDLQFPLVGEDPAMFSNKPALLMLGAGGWARVALPDGIDRANEWRLVSMGSVPAIVEHRASARARVWVRGADGSWDPQVWAIPRGVRDVVGGAGGMIVEHYEGSSARFEFVRGEAVIGRGKVADCPVDHSFGLIGDEIVVAGVDRSGSDARLYSARLERDGTVSYSGDLRPVSPISRRDVETLVVLIASAGLTMTLFLLRIGSAGQGVIRIPVGASLAPTWRRAGAAMIDLAPALMSVLWLWPMPEGGSTMADLTMAYGPWPPVTVGAIMFAHSTIGEWLFGMTLGKAIAGCRTVSTKTGRRPTFAQAAGRNFVKVACPPLGMVQAMSPGRPEPWGFSTAVILPNRGGEPGSGDGKPG
ncbi:MAG: RDD family protein [Phycisphaeraceae bacterium]|nr:RDD family protein [Phycisphaerales bacterium]MCB9842921.1 RDD family protein [Phycisphaeraceae bacterium]